MYSAAVATLEFDSYGIQGAGKTVCSLGKELSGIRGKWDKATRDPGDDVLGFAEIKKAFADTQETWSDELNVYVAILDTLCRNLQTSGKNYHRAEKVNVIDADRAGQ